MRRYEGPKIRRHMLGFEGFRNHPPGPRLNYASLVMHVFDGAPTIVMKIDPKIDSESSGLSQLNCTHTIAFPVSSAGGEAQAMRGHRQAFPTPRGDGKSDPKGGVARPPGGQGGCPPGYVMRGTPPRPPDVVARRL